MNSRRTFMLACPLAGFLSLTTCATAAEDQTPVIELLFVPCEAPLKGPSEQAHRQLQVFSDGTVCAWSNSGRECRSRMTRPQLEKLLHELIVDCRLGEVDSKQLEEEVQAEGLRQGLSTRAGGADDTVIRVHSGRHQIEVRCHATGLMRTRFPQVRSLQAVMLAQDRLQNVRALVLLGDSAAARMLAERANQSLLEKLPQTSPVTTRELMMVHTLPDGTRLVQFCQKPSPQAPAGTPLVIVSVMDVPGEQSRVMVMSGDRIIQ